MTTSAQLDGWAHTPIGRSAAPDVEAPMGAVAAAAPADAGLGPDQAEWVTAIELVIDGGYTAR